VSACSHIHCVHGRGGGVCTCVGLLTCVGGCVFGVSVDVCGVDGNMSGCGCVLVWVWGICVCGLSGFGQ
jgi:hypothetical protein